MTGENKAQWDQAFLRIAFDLSNFSKCVSKKVCALIVKDRRIISTGLNGTLPGAVNCNDMFDPVNFDREEHHTWSLLNEQHAEISAITFCIKNNMSIEGATIYCTLQPCFSCAKFLIASGIRRVVYCKEYDKASNSLELFQHSDIIIEKIELQ